MKRITVKTERYSRWDEEWELIVEDDLQAANIIDEIKNDAENIFDYDPILLSDEEAQSGSLHLINISVAGWLGEHD